VLPILATAAFLGSVDCAMAAEAPDLMALGRHLAVECTSCHRPDSTSAAIPSIAGRRPEDFARTLREYRTGARTNPVMVSVAGSLDEQQIAALAAYFGSLPKPPAPPGAPGQARN
jgi:cytochrome c